MVEFQKRNRKIKGKETFFCFPNARVEKASEWWAQGVNDREWKLPKKFSFGGENCSAN